MENSALAISAWNFCQCYGRCQGGETWIQRTQKEYKYIYKTRELYIDNDFQDQLYTAP